MEGYREPSSKLPEPRLQLCEKHNLHFDPALQHGCTICLRPSRLPKLVDPAEERTKMIAVVLAIMLVVFVKAVFPRHRYEPTPPPPPAPAPVVRPPPPATTSQTPASYANMATTTCLPDCANGEECVQVRNRPMCLRSCENGEVCSDGTACKVTHSASPPNLTRSFCIPN